MSLSRRSSQSEGGRVARRFLVSGRVQGVGFRYSTVHRARQLALRGWVRNRADGSVELVAEGPAEAVEVLIEWCNKGPSAARVDAVDCRDEPTGNELSEFESRH